MADEIVNEIKDAELAQLEAAKRGDADSFASHFHQEMDVFWHDGRPLMQAPECQVALRTPFEQGFKMDGQYDELNIRAITDTVGLLTGNLKLKIQTPDGQAHDMGFRLTSIRVKDGDDWKIVHWHESPMQPVAD